MNLGQHIITNILIEKASIDWNNYLTSEEVNKFLSKDDKVESAEEIVYNTKGNFYKKYFDKFKDEGWTKRELTQDLANFYHNGHLNEESTNKDPRIKYGPYKDAMGMWTVDLADGYTTDSGDSFIQEKTKKECLRMLDIVVSKINESVQGLEDYTENRIKDIIVEYIMYKMIEEAGYSEDDFNIKAIELNGSRKRGQARDDSDLDVVVEFEGDDLREDDLFNLLNGDDRLYIEDIAVDINPILAYKSGSIDDFMNKSNEYDKDKLKESDSNLDLWKSQINKKDTQELFLYLKKMYNQLYTYNDKNSDIRSNDYEKILEKINYIENKLGIKSKRGRELH